MRSHTFENQEDWHSFRKGRITGTRLKEIVVKRGTGKKLAFYELIAERMGISDSDEAALERGVRLEPEAVKAFEAATGKTVDTSLVIWTNDLNENISVSPDGFIDDTEAVETKCLSSARHIQAIIENEMPEEFELQARQYFVVNEKLQTLYFVMYDPRIVAKPIIIFEVHRSVIEPLVQESLAYELQTLAEVDEWVAKLSNF